LGEHFVRNRGQDFEWIGNKVFQELVIRVGCDRFILSNKFVDGIETKDLPEAGAAFGAQLRPDYKLSSEISIGAIFVNSRARAAKANGLIGIGIKHGQWGDRDLAG